MVVGACLLFLGLDGSGLLGFFLPRIDGPGTGLLRLRYLAQRGPAMEAPGPTDLTESKSDPHRHHPSYLVNGYTRWSAAEPHRQVLVIRKVIIAMIVSVG